MPGRDGSADRRREQHGHPLGLALVPHGNQVFGVLKDLLLGRAARSRLLLGLLPAGVLHFALVKAHERHTTESPSTAHSSVSISVTLPSIAMRGAIA